MTSKRHRSLPQHKIEGFLLARRCQCDNVLQSCYSGQFRRYRSLITASDNAALLPGVGGRGVGTESPTLSPPSPHTRYDSLITGPLPNTPRFSLCFAEFHFSTFTFGADVEETLPDFSKLAFETQYIWNQDYENHQTFF